MDAYRDSFKGPSKDPRRNSMDSENDRQVCMKIFSPQDLYEDIGTVPLKKVFKLAAHRVQGLQEIVNGTGHSLITYTIPPDGRIEELVPAGACDKSQDACRKPPPYCRHPTPNPQHFIQNIHRDMAIPLSGVTVKANQKPAVTLTTMTARSNPTSPCLTTEDAAPADLISVCSQYNDCTVRNVMNVIASVLTFAGTGLFFYRGIIGYDMIFLVYPAIGIGLYMIIGSIRAYLRNCGPNDVIFIVASSFLFGYYGAHWLHYQGCHWYPEGYMTAIGAFLVLRIFLKSLKIWPLYW